MLIYIYELIVGLLFVILIAVYLLFDETSSSSSHNRNELKHEIDRQIQYYLGIKTIISGTVALIIYIFFGPIMRIRFGNVFGILTFLLNYIPNIGPIIATFIPIPIILLDDNITFSKFLLIFLFPGVYIYLFIYLFILMYFSVFTVLLVIV